LPNNRLRVAVVGGGIGGLSAANALFRRGLDVTVFEQVETLREIGTGLSLFPNGRRQLERMGLEGALAQVGAKVADVSIYRMDGSLVGSVPTTDSSGWNGVYGMHRADLSRTLAEGLPAAVIRTAHRCVGFEQTDRTAQLNFANGTTAEADVVVGADGIQSFLQKHVVHPSTPEYSGSRAYRGLVPRENAPRMEK
jgi:2-polyprenyl-6-methoxyphenol hydroxylase-like FAD-dependent oxidoreductase